ncbi:hypothetical protein BGW42_001087 [Actinomortierella wolfii]|nr:hypothetical protein BGW42_001087 [Actinomortierella wolfii]
MKASLIALVSLMTPLAVMAGFDGNSKCEVQGFKIGPTKIVNCCLKNMGGSDIQGKVIKCTLPIGKEGWFRKCVKDTGYATVVDCDY